MAAAEYNITISQNSDFKRSFQLKQSNVVVDLTNFSFEGRLKRISMTQTLQVSPQAFKMQLLDFGRYH